MAALQSVGTNTLASTLFNTGKLTIDTIEVADIDNISINRGFSIKKTRILNSIKPTRIRRSELEDSVSFNINAGVYRKIIALFASSSSPVADGNQYEVEDGQQDDMNVYITCYQDDDTNKPIQYQLQNPVFSSANTTLASQEFGTVAVEVACTEIIEFLDTDVS